MVTGGTGVAVVMIISFEDVPADPDVVSFVLSFGESIEDIQVYNPTTTTVRTRTAVKAISAENPPFCFFLLGR